MFQTARHAANPCQQYDDTLGICLQLRIKNEGFKWIQSGSNGMFVGDEQHTRCALVVLGTDDLVQAKKELDRHQTVKQYVSSKHQDASSIFLHII